MLEFSNFLEPNSAQCPAPLLCSSPPQPAARGPTAYNQRVVQPFFSYRSGRVRLFLGLALLPALAIAVCAAAQTVTEAGRNAAGTAGGRILLVLPFDNRTGQPSLEWIREASAEILTSRLASAGFAPMSRADRRYALDHLGLPQSFHPTRATSLKLAETLAADSGLRLDAFEQYIRGITEPDQQERLRHLNQSVALSPEFSPAWMALGREEYAGKQYEQAAEAFAKVGGAGADALEAGFYRGLSLLFSGDYPYAQEAFAGVARELPLAEVLNNEGIALARQAKDGIPLFRQAMAADPNEADYHFNLAVSLKRHGDKAEALTELAQCLRLHPNDSEAKAAQRAWTKPEKLGTAKPIPAKPGTAPVAQPAAVAPVEAGGLDEDAKADPLERIERGFDAVAFHQAALMVEQVDASRMDQLAPRERAQKLSAQAHEYLDHGLLLEAERLYQAAVAVDPKSAAIHAGLAEVHERAGDAKSARKEAVTSLELMPSVDAYLVMVRLEIAANHFYEAQQHLTAALQIDPQNKAALELRKQIEALDGMKK